LVFVSAVALVDAFFIFLAGIGMVSIIDKDNVKRVLKYIGGIVLIIFGINTILGCFNYSIIPNLKINTNNTQNIFIQGLILTLSNPLTIIFWGGVFTGKMNDESYNKHQIFLFGLGCVISTLVFLSLIALAGTIVNVFLPESFITILNFIVGLVIILFGIKMAIKKK
jgi:threonine/homoserine/homoserine lactone efflux protein